MCAHSYGGAAACRQWTELGDASAGTHVYVHSHTLPPRAPIPTTADTLPAPLPAPYMGPGLQWGTMVLTPAGRSASISRAETDQHSIHSSA